MQRKNKLHKRKRLGDDKRTTQTLFIQFAYSTKIEPAPKWCSNTKSQRTLRLILSKQHSLQKSVTILPKRNVKRQIAKAADQKRRRDLTKLTKLNNLMNVKKGWNTSIILADAIQLMPRGTRTKDYTQLLHYENPRVQKPQLTWVSTETTAQCSRQFTRHYR